MMRSMTAGALALAGIAAGCILAAPSASAATQGCVTDTLTTGGYQGVGTIKYKSSASSCNDLNLTYSDDKSADNWDYYAGRYRRSDGTWVTGSKGYVYAADGYHSINDSTYWLVTDLNGGTPFTVASYYDSGDTVRITH